MVDVVTFGEAMVRLSPPNFQRLEQARSLDLNVGGAELNVAVGLVKLPGHLSVSLCRDMKPCLQYVDSSPLMG